LRQVQAQVEFQLVVRHARVATETSEVAREAERARADKAVRDRALAQEHKAEQRIAESRVQARQIIKASTSPVPGRASTALPPAARSAPSWSATSSAGCCPRARW
jgi:hypothetical protein